MLLSTTLQLCVLTSLAIHCQARFNWKQYQTVPAKLTTDELLSRFDYPFERYEVNTDDGFSIDLYHIPRGPETVKKKRRVVLLLPGLYCQSYFYFFLPGKSLGFVLPNMGYDTWVANFRAQSETELGPHPDSLGPNGNDWSFSIDEIAEFDVPALIDFVLEKSGAKKVTLVGHSMGNTAAFMMLASKPEYNPKVEMMIALGPAVYVTPNSGAGWFIAQHPIIRFLYMLANFHNNFEQLEISGAKLRGVGGKFCPPDGKLLPICRIGFNLIMGADPHVPLNVLPVLISHVSSASFMMHYQYLQHTNTGRFAKYDFGPVMNQARYGVPIAPIYDMRSITTPCALISGWDDRFNNIYNVRYLMRNIPKVVLNHVVPKFEFNHMSFVAAKDVDESVNKYIYELLAKDYAPATTLELIRTRLLTPHPDSLVTTLSRKLQFRVDQAVANRYDWYGIDRFSANNNPSL